VGHSIDFGTLGELSGQKKRLDQIAFPQAVIPGNRLNHLPSGTSGCVSSHSASKPNCFAVMLRCWIRSSR
jgi:hypothetical protein